MRLVDYRRPLVGQFCRSEATGGTAVLVRSRHSRLVGSPSQNSRSGLSAAFPLSNAKIREQTLVKRTSRTLRPQSGRSSARPIRRHRACQPDDGRPCTGRRSTPDIVCREKCRPQWQFVRQCAPPHVFLRAVVHSGGTRSLPVWSVS